MCCELKKGENLYKREVNTLNWYEFLMTDFIGWFEQL